MDPQSETLGTGIIKSLKERLTSEEFMVRHRRSQKDFMRKRCLPFMIVVLFLLNMVKRSLQDELDEFFKLLSGSEIASRIVSKSAFCQARKKLRYEAFIELNEVQVDYFYQQGEVEKWHGLRLVAVDGSTAELPNQPELIAHFGRWGSSPVARVSQLFDVLNKVTLEATIGPKAIGEREYAALHFEKVGLGDLGLLDRGYPAFWLFALIRARGAHFCARMPLGVWNVVKAFLESDLDEQIVTLQPGPEAVKDCQERGLSTTPLPVRLLRIELASGECEVLITSLLDTVLYPHSLFADLYHQRWPVEEDYKVIKCRVEVENFSGKSVLAIYQDFHAKVFTANLTAILAHPPQKEVTRQSQSKKYAYQINMTQALSKMKDTVVLLFHKTAIADLLSQLWLLMVQTTEPIRPGRKYPRIKRVKPRKFPMTYKPIR